MISKSSTFFGGGESGWGTGNMLVLEGVFLLNHWNGLEHMKCLELHAADMFSNSQQVT